MGVHNTSDFRETVVKHHMRRRIGRRMILSLHLIPFKINNYHIARRELLVFHAAWFDDKEPAFSINSADISPCKSHQAVLRQAHIRLIHYFFQSFQHKPPPKTI